MLWKVAHRYDDGVYGDLCRVLGRIDSCIDTALFFVCYEEGRSQGCVVTSLRFPRILRPTNSDVSHVFIVTLRETVRKLDAEQPQRTKD